MQLNNTLQKVILSPINPQGVARKENKRQKAFGKRGKFLL